MKALFQPTIHLVLWVQYCGLSASKYYNQNGIRLEYLRPVDTQGDTLQSNFLLEENGTTKSFSCQITTYTVVVRREDGRNKYHWAIVFPVLYTLLYIHIPSSLLFARKTTKLLF